MIDTIQKFGKSESRVKRLESLFVDCRDEIQYCLILFVITAVVVSGCKFLATANYLLVTCYVTITVFLFVHSFIKFVAIVQSMKELENFTLEQIKRDTTTK